MAWFLAIYGVHSESGVRCWFVPVYNEAQCVPGRLAVSLCTCTGVDARLAGGGGECHMYNIRELSPSFPPVYYPTDVQINPRHSLSGVI